MLGNLTLNGITVAMEIVHDPGLPQLAYEIIDEAIQAANAELSTYSRLNRYVMMALSDDMCPYKTTAFLDFVHRRPMEVQYLVQEPLDCATKFKVPAPQLSTVVRQAINACNKNYTKRGEDHARLQ